MKLNIKILLLFCIVSFVAFAQGDDKAKAIVKKAHEITLGDNGKSVMTMEIIRPEWTRSLAA